MALTDSEGASPFTMPVQPMYGYGGNNGGLFGNNGDLSWLILLLLCGWGGGFGMGGFGGGMWPAMMMGGMGGFGDFGLYPWMTTNQNVNNGFRDQQIQSSIGALQNSVTSGFGDVSTQLCGGFAGVNQAICQTGNGITAAVTGVQNALAQQLYTNEIGSLNRSFAEQTANAQGFNGVQAGVADLRYAVSTEACADRAAVGDALQAVTMQGVNNTNALLTTIRDGIQSIKDDLCQDRLDAERRDNANLRSELMYARNQADRAAQTAVFQQGLNNEVDALYNRLKNCPVNTVPVAGNTPLFSCNPGFNNGNCGCNGNLGFAG